MYYNGGYTEELTLTTTPFDDDNGTYNYDFHFYEPTFEYVKKLTGYDMEREYKGTDKAQQKRLEMCMMFMDLIYQTANPTDRSTFIKIKEYLAAKDHNIREPLLQAMSFYIRANIQSDIYLIGDEHGHNLTNNTSNKPTQYDDMPVQAKRKIEQTTLLYPGKYNFQISNDEYRKGY